MFKPIKKSPERAAYLLSAAIAVTAGAAAPPLVSWGIRELGRGHLTLSRWLVFASTTFWAMLLCRRALQRKTRNADVLITAMGVGILNTATCMFLVTFARHHSFIGSMGALIAGLSVGCPVGCFYGFAFGVALLPMVHLTRSLHERPSHDGYATASLISAGLVLAIGIGAAWFVLQPSPPLSGRAAFLPSLIDANPTRGTSSWFVAIVSTLIAASLAGGTLMSDISLVRFLRSARSSRTAFGVTHVLDPLARSTVPVLPLVRGSYGAVLTTPVSVGAGPFREADQKRVIASMPSRGSGAAALRMFISLLVIGGSVATLLSIPL